MSLHLHFHVSTWNEDEYNDNPDSLPRLGYTWKMIKHSCPRCKAPAYLEDAPSCDESGDVMLCYTVRHYDVRHDDSCEMLGLVVNGARP